MSRPADPALFDADLNAPVPLDDALIDRALVALAALAPTAAFFAVSPFALIVPMPETVPVAAEHLLHGHVSPLELIAQQDV